MRQISPEVRVTKYKESRFWAVWIGEELLAVVCYKKGAMAIRAVLNGMPKADLAVKDARRGYAGAERGRDSQSATGI